MVSRPVDHGGLGFSHKWNMGWMHDTLGYFQHDPVHRKFHHRNLTFGLLYAFTENFILPLSHDEVVHGKGSLLAKMPGDDWQKFANLRLLYGYMWAHPGKKLLFMGGEFGQRSEWAHERELDWGLLQHREHAGLARWVHDLNALYRDVRYLIPFLIQFWTLASPVYYSSSMVPERYRWLYGLNPMAGVIDGFRWALTGNGHPPAAILYASVAMVCVAVFGGLIFFNRMESTVADRVSVLGSTPAPRSECDRSRRRDPSCCGRVRSTRSCSRTADRH
jgi:hypothetical protein